MGWFNLSKVDVFAAERLAVLPISKINIPKKGLPDRRRSIDVAAQFPRRR